METSKLKYHEVSINSAKYENIKCVYFLLVLLLTAYLPQCEANPKIVDTRQYFKKVDPRPSFLMHTQR